MTEYPITEALEIIKDPDGGWYFYHPRTPQVKSYPTKGEANAHRDGWLDMAHNRAPETGMPAKRQSAYDAGYNAQIWPLHIPIEPGDACPPVDAGVC